ncbi:hypothetical protein LXA43DRAFT_1017884 [Ganoderma leucocontextum]|nr:hypothetical protein LXA43DRAFT_1017884 [Ganoderma leucocontextum]
MSTNDPPPVQHMSTNIQPAVQAQPLLANSQCQPLAPYFRLCFGDIAAIIGAIVFILYVVWGIPPTVRLYQYVRSRLAARRQRQLAVSQDLERNVQRDCPCDGSSSSTLQESHEREPGQAYPPLDDKIHSAPDQRRLNNFIFPTLDSWTSISRSIRTMARSPTQEFYSAPATPIPDYDESTSSRSSSPTTLPGADEDKCEVGAAGECQVHGVPLPASVDHPFGRMRAICKPCMW